MARERKIGVPDDWDQSRAVRARRWSSGRRYTVSSRFAGSYAPPKRAGKYKGGGVGPSPCYSYSACVVELTVDEETGAVDLENVWIGHDIGRALNPLLVEGQVEGSVYMGIGEALMEEQVFRKNLHKASVDARVQEPDHARDAGDPHDPRRDRRPRGTRSAPRKRAGARSCR